MTWLFFAPLDGYRIDPIWVKTGNAGKAVEVGEQYQTVLEAFESTGCNRLIVELDLYLCANR